MADNTARTLKQGNTDTEKLQHKLASDQGKQRHDTHRQKPGQHYDELV